MTLPPWAVGLAIVYAVSMTWWAGYLLLHWLRTRTARPDTVEDVGVAALAERPELADDAEAVARTVLALEEVAELRRLARADGEAAAFVSPGHRRLDTFLDEVLDRRQR